MKIAGKSGGVSFLYGVGYGSIGAAINLYSDVPAPKGGVQKETKVVGTDSSGSKLTATSWLDKDGERMGVTDFKVDNEKFAKYIIKTISDKDCKFIKNLLGSQPPAKPSASTVREVNPSLLPTQYSTAVVKNNQGVNTKTSNTFIPRIVFEPNRHKTLRVFSGIENLPDGKTRPVISGAEYYFGNLKIRQLGIPQDNKFK